MNVLVVERIGSQSLFVRVSVFYPPTLPVSLKQKGRHRNCRAPPGDNSAAAM